MTSLEMVLMVGAIVAVAAWAALSTYVLVIQRRRVDTRAVLQAATMTFDRHYAQRLTPKDRIDRLQPVLDGASRELIMRAAADPDTSDDAFAPLAGYFVQEWGIETLLKNASEHKSARDKWRRTTALKILVRLSHAGALDLLGQAVEERDVDIANVAFGLLGRSSDPKAIDTLIGALKRQRHSAARVAVHIDQSPQPVSDRLRALLTDMDPVVRLWGATLLARYPEEPIEQDLAALTEDKDPRVRKAAIQTLGKVGDALAATCALRLLEDPSAYVRGHAARALGELTRSDRAEDVAALLGDADFWVRLAARESLEMMGSDVWPVLMRKLNHDDRFVRNGAAEVIQNLGVLDSLIVMEAASDHPGEAKIAMLGSIAAAGGVRFTDSLVDRAGPIVGPRIRQLLSTIGLELVRAAS